MNFKSFKEKKERGVSVEEAINEAKEHQEIEDILIVAVTTDGEILVSYSTDNDAKLLGYIEVAKAAVVDSINYPE